jgi:aminopeptidase
MSDIRIDRWAHTLTHYCLCLKPGDIFVIQATPQASPLIEAVYREALQVGAHPVPVIELEPLEELLLRGGSDEQLTTVSPIASTLAERANARLVISSRSNPRALSNIEPARTAKYHQSQSPLSKIYRQREQMGEYRWCRTLFPTNGYAQEASMSLKEFEEFVYDICFLNDPDPIACWKELSLQQQRLVDWLDGHDHIHIIGEGTDLTLSTKDRIFINSDGKRNFPSGELFTSPVEDSANGVVQFDIPATYGNRVIEGVRLVFREGRVVEASARLGEKFLLQMLDLDAGARYLGEFAFGNNQRVNRATRNILFDEKIGGTVHMALGACYPETGGINQSALHWDMICDLRTRGEVWIDDTLFLKNGTILV